MSVDASFHHSHPHAGTSSLVGHRRVLAVALLITAVVLAVEVVGGVLTNSLALLADAGHMVTDVAALGLALFAAWFAGRPHSPTRSYGYHRVEILAALANGLALWAIAGYIFVEASRRFQEAPEVNSGPMLAVAAAGLVANLVTARMLSGGSGRSLNMHGAFLHVLGDALGSLGAILAGILMLLFGWFLADPIISVFIGVIVLVSSARLVWPAVHILLEGTPKDLDLGELEAAIQDTVGVLQVHDLHAWALTSGYNAVTAHVVLSEEASRESHEEVLDRLRHMLPARFPVGHLTIQLEESSHCCEEAHLPDSSHAAPAGRDAHARSQPGGRD